MPDIVTQFSLEPRKKDLEKISLRSKADLLNIFTPGPSITSKEPAKFAGRYKELEEMIEFLLSDGQDLIVFGDRGCGKTSLANMIHNIAQGKLEILDYYGLRKHFEKQGWFFDSSAKTFSVIWVDGFHKSFNKVVRSILTRRKDDVYGPGLLGYLSQEADKVEIASKYGISLEGFSVGTDITETYEADKPETIQEAFEFAMQRYADENKGKGLLIIIDEFETVKNGQEIVPYLKSARNAKFVICGVAGSAQQLIGEYSAVARELQSVTLGDMCLKDLKQILDVGFYIVSTKLENFVCHDDAKEEIAKNCYGSPYWCHLIAKVALRQTADSFNTFAEFKSGSTAITLADVKQIITNIHTYPDSRSYEQILATIPMEDPTTARVVLAMANYANSSISSTEICNQLAQDSISSEYTKNIIDALLNMPASPFKIEGKFPTTIRFDFKDPNFRKYILIRYSSLHKAKTSHALAADKDEN